MADAFDLLTARLADYSSLDSLAYLLAWDQRTMMPRAGTGHRSEHIALLERLGHETLTDPEIGRLLEELEPREASLDPDSWEAATIRVARRDYLKAVQVPTELRSEMARVASESTPVWIEAKTTSNFELFLPLLERNLELRHRYVECFGPQEEPYDVLLDDFEPEMKTAEVRRIFDEIKPELVQLIADLRDRDVDDSFLAGDFPLDRQVALDHEVVDLFGHRPDTWRIDPTEHPFAAGAGIDDVRITTHYYQDHLKSLFSTMHEYGHGLYAHQLPRDVAHLPAGQHSSLGIHESQSRLWENLVGRSLPFWQFFYPRLQEVFPEQFRGVELETFYAGINKVQPSLIRIEADEVTYGMHVILRFELEQDMINGRVELRDLPQRWAEKMEEYLGVHVPDDGRGVLQDMHWASGLIGYFATYLLGTVMSVQIWEKAADELGDLEGQVGRGEFAPLRDWLGANIHSQGRKYPPQELLGRATGSTIVAEPYLAYLKKKFGAPVAV
jgi:carboxypeptidase Taq